MATPQIGDVIKFAELAYMLLDYGWSEELNASRQFREFGQDLSHLAGSLQRLENVINDARSSFQGHGQTAPDDLGWDEDSLIDIIGDYYATLNECMLLVKANKSYMATTTGPLVNIHWNIFVQPQVEKLRRRILFHNTKIQRVLQPFEMDLHMRIYKDLAQRISHVQDGVHAVHHDVRTMHRQLQALMRAFDPSLIQGPEESEEPEMCAITVPEDIRQHLQALFEKHPENDDGVGGFDFPPLRDIADAFITSFDKSTRLFQPEAGPGGIRDPPEDQYLALLTSQFLMTKMLESPEYRDTPPASHWPSYIRNLQQQLSDECRRFTQEMLVPPSLSTDIPTFWPEEESPDYIDSVEIPTPMEFLLEMPLVTDTPKRWRRLKLFRYCDGTDKSFRLIITAGDRGQPAKQTLPIDFDISKASLIPHYVGADEREPLELVLKDGRDMHRLVFCSKPDLYTFQQALTAYEVVDQYMAYQLQVVFVVGSSQKVMEHASLQLWQPSRLAGERVVTGNDSPDSSSDRRVSTASSGDTIRQIPSTPSPPGPNFRLPARTQTNPPQRWDTPPNSSPILRSPGPSFINPSFNPPSSSSQEARRRASTLHDFLSPRSPRHTPSPISIPTPPPPRTRTWGLPFGSPRPSQPDRRGSTQPDRRGSTATTTATSPGRAMSILSTTSTATATPARPVAIRGNATVAETGTLHTMPTEPLLVLFTQHPTTRQPSVVALSLDHKTAANYHACRCTSLPHCPITAVERGTSGGPLRAMRLGPPDLLPLSEALRARRGALARRGMIRVSVCFAGVEGRMEFAGLPCGCVVRTEGELMECLRRGHKGRLGLVKEMYRRGMVLWNQNRFENLVDVVGAADLRR